MWRLTRSEKKWAQSKARYTALPDEWNRESIIRVLANSQVWAAWVLQDRIDGLEISPVVLGKEIDEEEPKELKIFPNAETPYSVQIRIPSGEYSILFYLEGRDE